MVRQCGNGMKNTIHLLDIFYLEFAFRDLICVLVLIPNDLLCDRDPIFWPMGLPEVL
jgi:hypothetical protein